MSTSHSRGHKTYYDYKNEVWRYCDTNEKVSSERPCIKCNCPPTSEGFDACIGFVSGIGSACCGHGTTKPIKVMAEDVPWGLCEVGLA